MYRSIVSAARVRGMLDDPAVLTAAKWQDWLHPRGKDGRFIEKGSFVNVFANPNALVNDKTAVRRRAKIVDLKPEGAIVAYQDINGKPLEADAAAGFPDMIEVDDLASKISTAPNAIAHLQPGESAAKEVKDALAPALTPEEYEDEILGLNQAISGQFPDQVQVVSTGQGEATDQEFTSHVAFIRQVNEMATGHGLTLDAAFKDSFGLWSEEMHQIFDSVVNEAYDELTNNQTKPRDNRAIMLGGLPGAGKSSTLKKMREDGIFRDDEWVTVNPDYFKDKILEKGIGPSIVGLTPAETSGFIHEASSEMNHMLENLLTAEGYNVIFDITMGGHLTEGEKSWTEKIIDWLESRDYATDGMFVSVTPDTASQRSHKRHRDGLNALRTGVSRRENDPEVTFGGRVVPESVLTKASFPEGDPQGEQYDSVNARNFDKIKGQFGRWAVWDNSGDAPTLDASSGGLNPPPELMPGVYPPSGPPTGEQAA
jgi:Zeta toxin